MRTALLLLVATVVATPLAADAGREPVRDLIHNTSCHEGNQWRYEWRVQLGVFSSGERAYDFEDKLAASGIAAETYFTNLDGPDMRVVVSPPLKSRKAAEKLAKRTRAVVSDALVRRYRYWY